MGKLVDNEIFEEKRWLNGALVGTSLSVLLLERWFPMDTCAAFPAKEILHSFSVIVWNVDIRD